MLKACLAACGLIFSMVSFAADVELIGTETRAVALKPTQTLKFRMGAPKKIISLLNLQLSAQAQENLIKRSQSLSASDNNLALGLPTSVQLEMNGVPVLDQGAHGSCVTFAVTAAIDAALFQTDAISQLCQLELGAYLEKVSNNPSGWDGSFGHIVLNQMDTFGVVTKTHQLNQGCGGLYEYPGTKPDAPSNTLTPEDFYQISLKPLSHFTWFPILHVNEALTQVGLDSNRVLNKVKEALNMGDRVVFGTLLVDPEEGVAGAVGTFHQSNDSWVLTPHLIDDMARNSNMAGHEMVITGYDDNAVAKDAEGNLHRGLLTLRNSWGPAAGDGGNNYMSYDYFRALVIEAHHIKTGFDSK